MQDTIPRNIFELGLKSHLGQPGLVLAYADFLLGEQLSITQLLINRQGDGGEASGSSGWHERGLGAAREQPAARAADAPLLHLATLASPASPPLPSPLQAWVTPTTRVPCLSAR